MAGKHVWKAAVALLLVFALVVTPYVVTSPVTAEAATLASLQEKQQQLKKQAEANKKKLEALKADKEKQQEYKETLDDQIATVQSQIDTLNEQISALDDNITALENQIADKQASIDENLDLLKKRIRAVYVSGETTNLEIILSAESVTDFADKVEILQAVTEHDTQLINSLKEEMKQIESQKAEIEESRSQVAESKKELDSKRSELNELIQESETVLANLASSEKNAEAEKARIAREERIAAQAVEQWMKDYYEQNQGGGGGGSTDYQGTGSFTWPLPGVTRITQYYKGLAHTGVDVGAPAGTTIVAMDGGKVIYSGYNTSGTGMWTYGNYVDIDHGNGYVTRYAHASALLVSKGQVVTKGQAIARVGNTGNSFGNHLHFEVYYKGVRQNPMNYFTKVG